MFKGTISVGITVASPLLILLSLALMPKLGAFPSVCFIISFGLFFIGEFIIPRISKEKEANIKEDGTYLGRMTVYANIRLKRQKQNTHDNVVLSYQLGLVAFVVGIIALVILRLS